MIYMSDMTLNQGLGNYTAVCALMEDDGAQDWMLRSEVTVACNDKVAFNYLLHFWQDGSVVIIATDHPQIREVTDDDIKELSKWVKDNGWRTLQPHKELISDVVGLNFWMRLYRSGVVDSDELKKCDDEEMERLSFVAGSKGVVG